MNADELFNLATHQTTTKIKHRNGSYLDQCGLSKRALHTLRHNGGIVQFDLRSNEYTVDVKRLKNAVVTGEIALFRNCGKKTIREICDWLAVNDNEENLC